MITHILDTIRRADSIVVLDHGVVAEQGTHEELVSLGRIYAELYRTREAASARSRETKAIHPAHRRMAWHAG